jgi:hypothetical protein
VLGDHLRAHGAARIAWHIRRRGSFQRWCHGDIGVFSNGSIGIITANNYSYVHYIKLHI